jgi:hypothetical protein
MKQILLLLMISSFLSFSQNGNSVSIGVDPQNLFFGSNVNDAAFDIQAKFTFRNDYDEYGLFAESFSEIKYFNWGVYWNANLWTSDYYHTIPRWQILGGFEASQIIKKERTRSAGFWTGAANLIGRYNFGKYQTYGIEIQSNYEYRPEWTKWVYSTYVNFIYHFEL